MNRTVVQVARVRIADLLNGDVVNGHPEHEHGWFMVRSIRQLPSGDLVASGETSTQAVKGQPFDLVGLQVTKVVEIPSNETRRAATSDPQPAPSPAPAAGPRPNGESARPAAAAGNEGAPGLEVAAS